MLNKVARKAGVNIVLSTLGDVPGDTTSSLVLTDEDEGSSLDTTIRLLHEFGDVVVMSSPQLMVLNNQTALLKRVENRVFFTFNSQLTTSAAGSNSTVGTNIHSLPVGIVMIITPHITKDGAITLHVRPTISRNTGIERQIPLPDNVNLPDNVANTIPETVTQEMESLIRLNSGEIAILGGLMQDFNTGNVDTIPGAGHLGVLSNLFKTTTKQFRKTEVVIFIRPLIVDDPSIEHDLRQYKPFLEAANHN